MSYLDVYSAIPGSVTGCLVKTTTQMDEINARIHARSEPDPEIPLTAVIDARPHPTRYTKFQVFDVPHAPAHTLATHTTPVANLDPNADRAPGAQFRRSIDLETRLTRPIRGEVEYVPDKNQSDLYNVDRFGDARWGDRAHTGTTLFDAYQSVPARDAEFVRNAPIYTGRAASRFFAADTSARNN